MSLPVLQTKLYAPPARTNQIRRPLLTAKLDAAGLHPLTLIAAPAGFGKTTLVTEWLAQSQQAVAWLSLAEDDNDAARFLTYLLAALRTITAADLAENALALLHSPQPPPLRSLLNTLAHALIADLPPCVLVLDDYHVISNQAIHEAVLFLVEHVPALHWIITTRADPALPLGRLRARQQLLELRSVDLRFSHDECSQLLNEVLQLALTTDAVQELQSKTEGWIAGLQLAGLAMQGSVDRAEFVREFFGSHRYIADYLADEVLKRLSAHRLHFLLRTAVLERMCAEVCAALVCEHGVDAHDSLNCAPALSAAQAQVLLEELERANLFLIPLDGSRRWYRYHHLFADLLRQRLHHHSPQLSVALHRRAATWFAHNGLLDDALRHAIAGEDFTQAADLLEQSNELFWMQGRFVTLRHWCSLLPSAVTKQRPRLLLAQTWTHVLTDSPSAIVSALFQDVEAAILNTAGEQQRTTSELQGVLAAIRAVYQSKQEDMQAVIAYAQQALAHLPQPVGSWRSIALMSLGFAYAMNGSVGAAQQTLRAAIDLCQQIGNRYSALVATMSLARTHMVQGQLHPAATIYTQGLTQAAQQGLGQLPVAAQAYVNLGRLHYEWNELTTAGEHAARAIDHLQDQGGSWLQFEGYVLLARVKQAQGNLAEALALLHQAEQVAQTLPFQWTAAATALTLVQVRLALGQDAGVDQWLTRVAPTPTDDLNRVREGEHLTAVRVLTAQGRSAEALVLLSHLRQVAEAAGRGKVMVESDLLAALAYDRQGDRPAAQVVLQRALALAEPEGYIRTFVDEGEAVRLMILDLRFLIADSRLLAYVNRILTAFGNELNPAMENHAKPAVASIQNPKSKIQNLVEPLSARELEILHLMAAGLANQEIADQLIITLGTVKSHTNHIFAKLGVQGRVKALNRARELALV